jgi:hypothetical protein
MSMELWQRLKDLEKKVAEQGEEVKRIKRLANPLVPNPNLFEVSNNTATAIIVAEPAAATKHKPCPKCGQAAARYFHVKYCTGKDGEVA